MTYHIFGRFRYFGVSLDVRIYPPAICDDTAGVKTILVRQTAGKKNVMWVSSQGHSAPLWPRGPPRLLREEARLFSFQTIGTSQTQTFLSIVSLPEACRGTKCDCYRLITRSLVCVASVLILQQSLSEPDSKEPRTCVVRVFQNPRDPI